MTYEDLLAAFRHWLDTDANIVGYDDLGIGYYSLVTQDGTEVSVDIWPTQ